MSPCHASKSATNHRLTRLGELLARASARRHQVRQIALETPANDPLATADPFEALFLEHVDLSIGEVMDMTGQSRTTVHRRLKELVEAGVLKRRGEGRASRYHRVAN